MNRTELLQLIPLYVLDALPEDERQQVDGLLATDDEARALLASYQQVESVLLLTAPHQAAPADLKARLMAQVSTAGATASQTPPDDRPDGHSDNSSLSARLWRGDGKPLLSVLLPAAATVVLLIGLFLTIQGLPDDTTTPQTLYTQLMDQPESERVALIGHLSEDISGELVIGSDGQQAVIRVEALPPLAEDEAFELWLIDDAGAVSGGVYRLTEPGAHYIALPLARSAYTYERFGVSLEPAAGSPYADRPSGPRVFDVALPGGAADS